jgi:protocatechuate 3,4-dioxygenase beta subunit
MTNKLIATATLVVLASIAQLGMITAQTPSNDTSSAIHGYVTDPSGAVIPEAMVTISNSQWNRTVMTDEAGQYLVSGLAPGHFRVRVRYGGFETFEKANFVVAPARQTEVNAQLELREAHQVVSVFE